MPDVQIKDMTVNTTPASSDIVYVQTNPGTTPVDRGVAISDLVTKAHGLVGANRVLSLNGANEIEATINVKATTITATTLSGTTFSGTDVKATTITATTISGTTISGGNIYGTAQIKIDDLLSGDNNTDLNASTTAHGLLPQLGGGTTNYLRADGTWDAPPGGAGDIKANGTIPFTSEFSGSSAYFSSGNVKAVTITATTLSATTISGGNIYGTAQIKIDDLLSGDDNTDSDATTGAHGLLPKLAGGTASFLRADGTWGTPAGAGDVLADGTIPFTNEISGSSAYFSSGSVKAVTVTATTFSGTNIYATTITATTLSGILSGNVKATTITATTLSGTTFSGTDIKATTITGTTLSGTTFSGTNVYVTALTATNISAGLGATTILLSSGTISATTISATTFSGGNIYGTAQIKIDDLLSGDNNTDLNASTVAHGLLLALGGGTTNYLRADGTWATPVGSGLGDMMANGSVAFTAEFSGTNAYFSGTVKAVTLTGTTFSGTSVYATTITGTTLTGATFSGTNIKATTLTGTTFSGTNVYVTTLTGTTFSGTSVYATTITGTTLSGTTLSGTTLSVSTINLPSSNADPGTTVGQIRHDTTITGITGGAVKWYDGTNVRTVVDFGTTATTQYNIECIPVAWFLSGAVAPGVTTTLSSTNAVSYRDYSGTANNDSFIEWQVPYGIIASAGITYQVEGWITASTAPINGETVKFVLSGASYGDSDHLSGALGSGITVTRTFATADPLPVQYDRWVSGWSTAVTATDLAGGELAILRLSRDTTDTYTIPIGVGWLKLKYAYTMQGS